MKVNVKKEGVLVDFIHFIKQIKWKNKKDDYFKDNISMELRIADEKELNHLGKEFINYKKLYPYEK